MATGFTGLDNTVPADTAFIGDGASEIRAVKDALITVFPDVNGAITKPSDYGPTPGSTSPTEADFAQLFTDMDALVSPTTSNSPVIPQGMVTMWNGDTSNTSLVTALNDKGWYLCVGGTAPNGFTIPNLQDKFIKGWGAQIVGATGGGGDGRTGKAVITGTTDNKSVAKSVTLTEANIPEHKHFVAQAGSVSPDADGNQLGQNVTPSAALRYGITGPGAIGDAEYEFGGITGAEADVFSSSKYGNASPTGIDVGIVDTDFAHEHLITEYEPGYYAIAYIIYAGVV